MNQDANKNPTQTCLPQDLQLEIRGKREMACKAVTSESDVDPLPLKRKAKSTSKKQVCDNDIGPSLVHTAVAPSHDPKYDWMPKFYFLKNHIAPKLPPISVLSLSNKDAGDVDFAVSKPSPKEIGEDAVDPKPHNQGREIPKHKRVDLNHLPPVLPTGSMGFRVCEEDGMFLTTKTINPDFDNVDTVVYDYDWSHSVDAIVKSLDDEEEEGWYNVDAMASCQGTDAVVLVNSEIFSDSADGPSSATDDPKIAAEDWEPQEAERILSGVYDLGEACICLAEDGCICSLQESFCPDEEELWKELNTKATSGQQQAKDSQRRENRSKIEPEKLMRPVGKARLDKKRVEGTSTDLHFHQSSMHSGVDQNPGMKNVRRKNNKLSERVLCRRRFSPSRFETEVDPTNIKLAENVASCDTFLPGQLETGLHLMETNTSGKSPLKPIKMEKDIPSCQPREKVTPRDGSSADAELHGTISSAVDAGIISKSSTVDVETNSKFLNVSANRSSAVDAEVTTKSSIVHAKVKTKSVTCDTEVTTKSSTVDAEVSTKSSTVDAEVSTKSSTVDAEVSTTSSTVDAEVSTTSSTVDAEVSTTSSTVDAEVSTTSSTVDAEVSIESSTVDNQSAKHDSSSMTEVIATSKIFHAEVTTKCSDFDAWITKSSTVDADLGNVAENDTANKRTMENTLPSWRLATSPPLSKPTPVENNGHLQELKDDFRQSEDKPEEVFDVLESESTQAASGEATPEAVSEDYLPKLSPPRKSHSDPDAAHTSKPSMNAHGISVDDVVKLPASFPSLKAAPSKTRLSRIPKPVAAKAGEKMCAEQQLQPGSDSHPQIMDSVKLSLNVPPSGESQNKPTLGTKAKLPSLEESRCKSPLAKATKSPSSVEENSKVKIKMITTENCPKPYVPQMITFYRHQDAKLATTIPPVSPKIRKTEKTTLPDLPPWNCSTYVEKLPKPISRPFPLHSKRNDSLQSLVSSASESSRCSVSLAKAEDSLDRIADFVNGSASSTKSESEAVTNPQRHQVNGSPRTSSRRRLPLPKQPFRPAGVNPATFGEPKKLIPASNTARSHPNLRVPGCKVEVPVYYPSTHSDTSAIMKTGTKRAHDESSSDNKRPSFLPDRNYLYPHSVPEAGVDENSNSVSGSDTETSSSFFGHSFDSGMFSGGLQFPKGIRFGLRPRVEDNENGAHFYSVATGLGRIKSSLAKTPIYYSVHPPTTPIYYPVDRLETTPMYYPLLPPVAAQMYYPVHSPVTAGVATELPLPRQRSIEESKPLGTSRSGIPIAQINTYARRCGIQQRFMLSASRQHRPELFRSRAQVPLFDFSHARKDLINYRSKMKKD